METSYLKCKSITSLHLRRVSISAILANRDDDKLRRPHSPVHTGAQLYSSVFIHDSVQLCLARTVTSDGGTLPYN